MFSLPNCTGGLRSLASSQENPVSIAARDRHVFWANQGMAGSTGSIMGMSKQEAKRLTACHIVSIRNSSRELSKDCGRMRGLDWHYLIGRFGPGFDDTSR